MKVPDLVRRLGAMFTWPPPERRTVFWHNDDPWYELYYDGRAQAVLEYRGMDGRTIQRLLSPDQEKEFGRRGPVYIAELYRATAAGRTRGDTPSFDPPVELRLREDYPDVARWIAAKHLASYGAGQPHRARVTPSLADGRAGNMEPGSRMFELVRDFVDAVALASEYSIETAMRSLVWRERLVAEGAGATGVGALFQGGLAPECARIGVMVAGQNVDEAILRRVLA